MSATRKVVLEFPVQLTPVTGKPSVPDLRHQIHRNGLTSAPALLVKEAARLERLAEKNRAAGKENGWAMKRARAAALRNTAKLLIDVAQQMNRGGVE